MEHSMLKGKVLIFLVLHYIWGLIFDMSPRKTNIWHRGEVFQTYGMLSCTISLTLCLQESSCTSPILSNCTLCSVDATYRTFQYIRSCAVHFLLNPTEYSELFPNEKLSRHFLECIQFDPQAQRKQFPFVPTAFSLMKPRIRLLSSYEPRSTTISASEQH